VKVLGDETLRTIARELVATVRKNVTNDWTLRENVRAQLRVLVKRILRKYGYPRTLLYNCMHGRADAHCPDPPRFRRAPELPAFRLTDDDVEIVRQLARHRFLRSTHIAALVSRPFDRTNDRLLRLFHAGYIDRPRAQLDF
jgi:hypothetical protein